MLLKTLQLVFYFCCGLYVVFTICAKTKGGKGKYKKKRGEKVGKDSNTNESEGDVKFNINVKPTTQKRDEFDDDEENPLAKIPTKPRLPKQKVPDTTSRTSSTVTNGSKMEAEASFFAPHEKTTAASCYMKTANKG